MYIGEYILAKYSQSLYTQRLLSLPILQSIEDLSVKTRLPSPLLSQYLNDNSRYYCHISVPKKNGGYRPIDSPNRQLKAIQRWILRHILEKLQPSVYATGFVPGIALKRNAIPHTGNQYILKLDLKDFFPSIKASYVYSVFRAAGYSKQIAYSLTSICTLNGYLPQGAPTSPCLSNLVCLRLDQRIGKYCDRHALTFTRYADDISISGNKLSIVKKAWVVIKLILSEEGYVINKNKEMLSGPRSKREITGLVVTPKLGIGQRKYNMYRNKIFHLCHKNDNESILIIQGILAYIKGVDQDRYSKLKNTMML
ncbi:TPA: RNA-directed DNA polymerase [Salmonella enterica]|nr:RNA-directed DNA polymerase [Salmonella enterica]EGK5153319.1 RNA-directed DNA polymerase [Salmonella enterica]HAF1865610.1 RNA-directed DNA polymerase [Salmonella enterica]